VSYRGGRFDLVMDHRNITQQEIRRRLLTPDEAMRLDSDHAVVFVAGQQPIYAEKLRYFARRAMAVRSQLPPPEGLLRLEARASPWLQLPPARARIMGSTPSADEDLRPLCREPAE